MNDDETHNRLVLEEYKIWKRATPFLYDVIVSHTLEWPVAHAHWLPQRRTDANGIHVQRLALASHRSILLADARLPCVPIDLSDPQFHPSVHDAAAITSVSFSDNDLTATTEGALGKLEIVQRIDAPAPVRCVRANPNAPWLLAARLADGGDSLIYDSSALPPRPPLIALSSKPPASSASTSSTPLLRLRGHDLAGGALSWSPCRANTLASVGADGRICIFDVSAAMSTANSAVSESAQAFDSPRKGTKAIAPKSSTSSAGSGLAVAPLVALRSESTASKSSSSTSVAVHCLDWHHRDEHVLATGGEDRRVRLWDTRSAFTTNSKPNTASGVQILDGHKAGILSVSFSPCSDHMLLVASADKTISLWDRRNPKIKLHSFEYHSGPVLSVAWSPFSESVFASSGADRRVMVWDVRKIGDEQNVEDVEDGPPELLFVHGGHTAPVPVCAWAGAHAPWLMATAANNGVMQFWQMQSQLWKEPEMPIDGGDLNQ